VRHSLPKWYFNTANADVRVGLAALKAYQREWDSKAQMFKASPKHDWSSNPADSARYMALATSKSALKSGDRPRIVSPNSPTGAAMNLFSLFEEREKRTSTSRI